MRLMIIAALLTIAGCSETKLDVVAYERSCASEAKHRLLKVKIFGLYAGGVDIFQQTKLPEIKQPKVEISKYNRVTDAEGEAILTYESGSVKGTYRCTFGRDSIKVYQFFKRFKESPKKYGDYYSIEFI